MNAPNPFEMSDEALEQSLFAAFEQALADLPRQHLPAGTLLLEQDKAVHAVWIVMSGDVALSRRAAHRDVVFHSRTTGRIVGLMAMAQRRKAFFTCRAVTDVTAVQVSWERLDEMLSKDAALSARFLTLLVRSMATRLRKIAELQIEVENLNTSLAGERDQLAATLTQLECAQGRLVHSEKLATLGQLSAGIAHELNNPVTAVKRSADYLAEDLPQLLEELPDGHVMVDVLRRAMNSPPIPTAELRRRRDELARAIGDGELARRLVNIGITTAAPYRQWLAQLPPEQRLRRLAGMERAWQFGIALRSLRTSSERVREIVRSFRSYARPDGGFVENVDLHDGIEDTLLLFGPSLAGIEVVRRYGPLPRVCCRPGELNQVWTNLISNALEAMAGRGQLIIESAVPDPEHVRLEIIDTGPGIAPEHLPRIFELNFTTKRGQAQFGLGLGLMISRQIVERHGGEIRLESQPGRTRAIVTLPVQCQPLPGEQRPLPPASPDAAAKGKS